METSDSRPRPTRAADLTKRTATFEEVDIRSELYARPQRTPDYAAEHRAMTVLAAEMTVNPRNMLQKLVETAIDLCRAAGTERKRIAACPKRRVATNIS